MTALLAALPGCRAPLGASKVLPRPGGGRCNVVASHKHSRCCKLSHGPTSAAAHPQPPPRAPCTGRHPQTGAAYTRTSQRSSGRSCSSAASSALSAFVQPLLGCKRMPTATWSSTARDTCGFTANWNSPCELHIHGFHVAALRWGAQVKVPDLYWTSTNECNTYERAHSGTGHSCSPMPQHQHIEQQAASQHSHKAQV